MKKVFGLILVSALGGALTLGVYTYFIEKPQQIVYEQSPAVQFKSTPVNHTATTNLSAAGTVDFTNAADITLKSVVHVKNKSIYTTKNQFEGSFYGRSKGRERVQVGIGSGVIISSDGYIITNNHVIKDASEIEITLNNKKTYIAELVGTDLTNDIALIKVDAQDLPYVVFGDSDAIKVGEWVLAVGNPYNLTATVTAGIISAKGRNLLGNGQIDSYIQTDAVVNSGNSGGALVNARGELIGINTMITSTTGSYIGYSFAVPSNIAKKVIEDILEYGNVQRAFIGINYQELNGSNHNDFEVENTEGVIITNVLPKSGAAEAGILKNDIIVKANNVEIATFADLKGFLKAHRPNDIIDFEVIRNGEKEMIPVELYKNVTVVINKLGLSLKNINKEEAKNYKLNQGVKIDEVTNEKLAEYGLKSGHIVKRINGKKIYTVDDANNILNNLTNDGRIVLEILTENGITERYIFN